MRLVRETQLSEQHPHCEHGMRQRPITSLEAWYHDPQPDGRVEYWLHVCNVANPVLAMEIYRQSLIRVLVVAAPKRPEQAAAAVDFLLRFARCDVEDTELQSHAAWVKGPERRALRYEQLAWRTARWALGLEETVGPVFCVPLLCEIGCLEDPGTGFRTVCDSLWKWWKTLTTPKEWAGGVY